MATGCVSVIDGLKTLKAFELVVDLSNTSITTFNLSGIDAVTRELVVLVPENFSPSTSLFKLRSDALRRVESVTFKRQGSGTSGFVNPLQVNFPKFDFGSDVKLSFFDMGASLQAFLGASQVSLEPKDPVFRILSASTKSGPTAEQFTLLNSQLPHDNDDKLGLISNWGGDMSTLDIRNNTGLGIVSFATLGRASFVQITSNTDLHTVELGIADAITIQVQENGPKLNLSLLQLDNIGREWNLSPSIFGGLSLISLPRLEKFAGNPGGLTFAKNDIAALQLPRLGLVNGSLTISDNKALFDLGLPRLQTVTSDLIIHDNPRLANVTANVLKSVSSISLIGPFTNVEFFSLEQVSGDFEVIGDPSMDCSWFDEHLRDKVVKGHYTCVGNHTYTPRRPSTSTDLPPGDLVSPEEPGSEEGGGLTTAAVAGIGAGAGVVGLALIGLGVWAFLRWRRKKGDGVRGILPWGRKKVDTPGPTDKPELDGAGKPLAEKDGEEVDNKDVAAGELPAEGWGEPRVARTVNSEGQVVELP